jgi:hypothetical protein
MRSPASTTSGSQLSRSKVRTTTLAVFAWLAVLSVHEASADVSSEGQALQFMAAANESGTGNVDASTCSFRDKRLFGKVKVVESFPDVRVKVVSSFPDLKVKKVDSFADECGEWHFVESFPDFTIQYVESFADVEISMVPSFPGMP